MFLMGLKLTLGLVCGLWIFGGVLIGLSILIEWLKTWRKTESGQHVRKTPAHQVEFAISCREKLLVFPVDPSLRVRIHRAGASSASFPARGKTHEVTSAILSASAGHRTKLPTSGFWETLPSGAPCEEASPHGARFFGDNFHPFYSHAGIESDPDR